MNIIVIQKLGLKFDYFDEENKSISNYELNNLELALRIKDKIDNTKVEVISLSSIKTLPILKDSISRGADFLHFIDNSQLDDYTENELSTILFDYISKISSPDIIFVPNKFQNLVENIVAPKLAGLLNLPYFYNVINVEKESNSLLLSIKENKDKILIKENMPLVLSASENFITPRYANIRNIVTNDKFKVIDNFKFTKNQNINVLFKEKYNFSKKSNTLIYNNDNINDFYNNIIKDKVIK